jgi:hypothetical protein
MVAQNTNDLERVRYWQGQLLASGDLETQLRVEQELRRLHNRAVHQAYGIAIGLELERDQTTKQIKLDGEGRVTLTCGLAYDCAGRELVLQSDRAVSLPPEFPMTLVIKRDQSNGDGISLRWKKPHEVNTNTEVAVTTLIVDPQDAGKVKVDPGFREVVARPLARPRLATGQTIPGQTTWQPWTIGDTTVGVKVEIDTSAAGFTKQPHYFAEVLPGNPTTDFVPAWFASIADPSTQGFTFQLMLHRITPQTLEIVDLKGRVQSLLGPQLVELDAGNIFVTQDNVARLLPLAAKAAVIKALNGANAGLDPGLEDFTGAKDVAFGNVRREAVVKKVTKPGSFFEVTVDEPAKFAEDNVVVKTSGLFADARASRIVSIDEDTLELVRPITGLVNGDTLGHAQPASTVSIVNGTQITVNDLSLYSIGNIVVRLTGDVVTTAPARIDDIKDGALLLSKAISDLAPGDSLGVVHDTAKVTDVVDNSVELKIEVDNAKVFRQGDLVAKDLGGGKFSAPVRVNNPPTPKKLVLSSSIGDLAENDIIVAADFPLRATVSNIGTPDTIVTVGNATIFPNHSFVARIDELLSASLPASVNSTSGAQLTLASPIADLQNGHVIGLCSFPSSVLVNSVGTDGSIEVSSPGVLRKGDLITALPAQPGKMGLALVSDVSGTSIRLAGPLEGLTATNRLTVVSMRGVVNVNANPGAANVKVAEPDRVRKGDFLADIIGWRQVQSSVSVVKSAGVEVTLASPLDGLLRQDTIGLASLVTFPFFFGSPALFFARLRLKDPPEDMLAKDDDLLILGSDRLTGLTHNLTVKVMQIIPQTKTVILLGIVSSGLPTFRPEDLSASVPFVRGSSLRLISKHDLFVSWLAVGESDQMPRPCAGTDMADCECWQVKE